MAHNTQLILQSCITSTHIVSQELLGGKLLRLTNKETFYTEECYKEGETRPSCKEKLRTFYWTKVCKAKMITWYCAEIFRSVYSYVTMGIEAERMFLKWLKCI